MDFKLPMLGEGADSGVVVTLHVKVGDTLKKNQPVLDLENEKAVASIPSSVEGVVSKIHVKEGDKISVGARILSVSADGKPELVAEPEAAPVAAPAAQPVPVPAIAPPPAISALPSGVPPAASPSIRKLAAEIGLDLTRVRGSGRGGRIELGDVRTFIQQLQALAFAEKSAAVVPAKPVAESIDFSKWGPVLKKPVTPLRSTIARRMVENWNAIPHVTQFEEADITDLLVLRKKHVEAYEAKGARLTVTSMLLKAVVDTLRKHPIFNCSLDEAAQQIVYKEYFHIGIAVDTDNGLIVPVIRDADKKTVFQLSKELEDLAAKARDRKVTGEELKGGTFTISNQGGIGGAHFTPIVNKPEVAILGLGKGALKPAVRNGKVEPRTLLPLAISYDHRVIDGANAARFAVDLVEGIQGISEAGLEL
ncbi:MAG: 2-oxo acid dehydrogenase subunit E2 [Verrucomicrobia bacterium]|jgi:pyruvate dehydrogenase E2 component (dihydrolipoamide acetyltransferase)|nr:2-oxo acid dehydrogenase subunit E2 [Verrucomicrobiota bacterium]